MGVDAADGSYPNAFLRGAQRNATLQKATGPAILRRHAPSVGAIEGFMREIIRVVVLPLLLMGGILGIFYLVFGRRIKERQDPPGVRTFATFDGFEPESDEPAEAGQAIAGKLHGALGRAGLDLNPVEAEDIGWSIDVGAEERAFILRVGYVGDDGASWLLCVDPHAPGRNALQDSAGLRRVLSECHAALTAMGARTVRWHRREDHARGDASQAGSAPF